MSTSHHIFTEHDPLTLSILYCPPNDLMPLSMFLMMHGCSMEIISCPGTVVRGAPGAFSLAILISDRFSGWHNYYISYLFPHSALEVNCRGCNAGLMELEGCSREQRRCGLAVSAVRQNSRGHSEKSVTRICHMIMFQPQDAEKEGSGGSGVI